MPWLTSTGSNRSLLFPARVSVPVPLLVSAPVDVGVLPSVPAKIVFALFANVVLLPDNSTRLPATPDRLLRTSPSELRPAASSTVFVPVSAMAELPASAPVFDSDSVPASIVVVPVKLLAEASVSVPAPRLTRAPLPETTPIWK